MTTFLTCDGYKVIITMSALDLERDGRTVPCICADFERARDDGYVVVATRDGLIVADGGGWFAKFPCDAYERAEASFGEEE